MLATASCPSIEQEKCSRYLVSVYIVKLVSAFDLFGPVISEMPESQVSPDKCFHNFRAHGFPGFRIAIRGIPARELLSRWI
uniref:Uncharacterized protein n=1 Tax=Ralstonia syzygii R24 TaxID=907261 RepID=G3AC43_9RALS|nr:hypothetical protein RALSY_mp30434 [Ralstonia syzygii R24]